MIEILYVIIITLFLLLVVLLARIVAYFFRISEGSSILKKGLLTSLQDCGFGIKNPHPRAEQYRWVVETPEKAPAECLQRTHWPAMDISDWMKAGLPNSKESNISCASPCQCRLERIERPD